MHRLSDKNLINMTAVCAVCGPNTPLRINYRGYYQCRNKWLKDAARANAKYAIKRKWGDTDTSRTNHVTSLLDAQHGLCAICDKELSASAHIDHDHSTGEIRGLLCPNCNLGLGHFKDNTNFLQKAIEYLALGQK